MARKIPISGFPAAKSDKIDRISANGKSAAFITGRLTLNLKRKTANGEFTKYFELVTSNPSSSSVPFSSGSE
jgi:hypothetical protein